MPQHDDATRRRCLEHVAYEIRMLVGALSMNLGGATVKLVDPVLEPTARQALTNALVELRALHARNVAEFLMNRSKRSNALCAEEYVAGFAPRDSEPLEEIWSRASREVGHLTTDRVTDAEHRDEEDPADKSWPLSQFLPLLRDARTFVAALVDDDHWIAPGPLHCQLLEALAGLGTLIDRAVVVEARPTE